MKLNKIIMYAVITLVVLYLIRVVMKANGMLEGFEGDGPTFTLYYADWCPHCKTVKPLFSSWSKNGSVTINGKRVNLQMVEESQMKDKSVPIKGYPTMLLKTTGGTYIEFSGDRSPRGWESWLSSQNL
jgi:thiol-disulfide isomerase/thioredoxin